MIKLLAYSHEDYVAKMVRLFDNIDTALESIEAFLGVEFAMRDQEGTTVFLSDKHADLKANQTNVDTLVWAAYWEEQEPDYSVFRVRNPAQLPERYPAYAVALVVDDLDRLGTVSVRAVEFVYQSDFNTAAGAT